MATILEELLMRLKVDQSQVGPALQDFKQKMGQAATHGHSSFLKIGSAGRAFKQVLHQISDASPVMGNALRIAISPIVGTMMAATAAFVYFNKKIEEANERLDKMAEMNAKPFGDIKKAAREATEEVTKLGRELDRTFKHENTAREEKKVITGFEQGMDEQESRSKTARKQIESNKAMELDKVKHLEATGAISQGEALRRTNSIESSYAGKLNKFDITAETRHGAELNIERIRILPELNTANTEAAKWRRLAALPWSAERQAKDKASLAAAEQHLESIKEAKKGAIKWGEGIRNNDNPMMPDWLHKVTSGFEMGVMGQSPNEMQAELQRQQNLTQKNIDQIRARVNSRGISQEGALATQKETDDKAKRLADRFEELGKAVEKSKLKLEELKNMPLVIHQQQIESAGLELLPTIKQLAQSGYWGVDRWRGGAARWHSGPYANMANELETREARAPWEAAWGNMQGHNEDVLRIRQIKDELRSAGIIAPGDAQEKVETNLVAINDTLSKGISVTVKNTD